MLVKMFTIFLMCIIIRKNECVKFSSLDKTYNKGVEAYSKERWSECIVQFEESLRLHKLYSTILINCRLKCKSKNQKSRLSEKIDDLKLYELFFNNRDCLTKCQSEDFENVHMFRNVSDAVLVHMRLKKPYEYLHLCYYQTRALPKAADAAYTYLVAYPTDEVMKSNLKYYTEQPEVDINEVTNLESKNYEAYYKLGIEAYKLEKWEKTIINIEETLKYYLIWENSCRAECEEQPEQEWSSEFTISVAYNMASLLTCMHKCQNQLRPLYNSGIEFLADLLNYLQISYYHLNKLDDAAQSVASYLLLLPEDTDMVENKHFYNSLLHDSKFTERSDIVHYFKRNTYEEQLLRFFHKEGDNIKNTIVN